MVIKLEFTTNECSKCKIVSSNCNNCIKKKLYVTRQNMRDVLKKCNKSQEKSMNDLKLYNFSDKENVIL